MQTVESKKKVTPYNQDNKYIFLHHFLNFLLRFLTPDLDFLKVPSLFNLLTICRRSFLLNFARFGSTTSSSQEFSS